jgi:hypothetical protein
MSMFSVRLDCIKLSLCLFPRDANKSTNVEGVFPVVATETYRCIGARILVLQAIPLLAIVNLLYSMF